MRQVGIAKAKTHLLSLVDEIEQTREPLTLTRNGRQVARVIPIEAGSEDVLDAFHFDGGLIVPSTPEEVGFATEDWNMLK